MFIWEIITSQNSLEPGKFYSKRDCFSPSRKDDDHLQPQNLAMESGTTFNFIRVASRLCFHTGVSRTHQTVGRRYTSQTLT
jgi:hypothetical protein